MGTTESTLYEAAPQTDLGRPPNEAPSEHSRNSPNARRPLRRPRPASVSNVTMLRGIILGLPSSGKRTLLQRLQGKDPFVPTEDASLDLSVTVPYQPPPSSSIVGDRIQLQVQISPLQKNADDPADFCVVLVNPRHDPKRMRTYIAKIVTTLLQHAGNADSDDNLRPMCLCLLLNFRDLRESSNKYERILEADLMDWAKETLAQHPVDMDKIVLQCGTTSLLNCYGLSSLHHFIYRAYLQRKQVEYEQRVEQVRQALVASQDKVPFVPYHAFLEILPKPGTAATPTTTTMGKKEVPIQGILRKPTQLTENGRETVTQPASVENTRDTKPADQGTQRSPVPTTNRLGKSVNWNPTRRSTAARQIITPKPAIDPKQALEAFFAEDDDDDSDDQHQEVRAPIRKLVTKISDDDDDDDDFYYDDSGHRRASKTWSLGNSGELESSSDHSSSEKRANNNQKPLSKEQSQTPDGNSSSKATHSAYIKETSVKSGDGQGIHNRPTEASDKSPNRLTVLNIAVHDNESIDNYDDEDQNGWDDDDIELELDEEEEPISNGTETNHQSGKDASPKEVEEQSNKHSKKVESETNELNSSITKESRPTKTETAPGAQREVRVERETLAAHADDDVDDQSINEEDGWGDDDNIDLDDDDDAKGPHQPAVTTRDSPVHDESVESATLRTSPILSATPSDETRHQRKTSQQDDTVDVIKDNANDEDHVSGDEEESSSPGPRLSQFHSQTAKPDDGDSYNDDNKDGDGDESDDEEFMVNESTPTSRHKGSSNSSGSSISNPSQPPPQPIKATSPNSRETAGSGISAAALAAIAAAEKEAQRMLLQETGADHDTPKATPKKVKKPKKNKDPEAKKKKKKKEKSKERTEKGDSDEP